MHQALINFALLVFGLPVCLGLFWVVHCALTRVCVLHAQRFCRRHGLEISRIRWQIEFEPSGGKMVKTEFTLVQLDCSTHYNERRLLLLRTWPLGVRKMLSNEKYPESYEEEWPQEHCSSP